MSGSQDSSPTPSDAASSAEGDAGTNANMSVEIDPAEAAKKLKDGVDSPVQDRGGGSKRRKKKYEDDESLEEEEEEEGGEGAADGGEESKEGETKKKPGVLPERTVVGRSTIGAVKMASKKDPNNKGSDGSNSDDSSSASTPAAAIRKKKITSNTTVSINLLSACNLHHGLMEKVEQVKVVLELVSSEGDKLDTVSFVGAEVNKKSKEDGGRQCSAFSIAPDGNGAEGDRNGGNDVSAATVTDSGEVWVDYKMSQVDVTPSALSKLMVNITVSRVVKGKDSGVVGHASSGHFMSLPYDEGSASLDLSKHKSKVSEAGRGKVKDARGTVKLAYKYNRKISESSVEQPSASAAPPDMKRLFAEAMKDPVIAKAMANPSFAPIMMKIKSDPSILSNPLERLKEDLAANPAAAKAAKEILPKLKAMLSPKKKKKEKEEEEEEEEEEEAAGQEDENGGVDFGKVMSLAMKDPVIAKAMANPSFAPIMMKIKSDPSILSNPLERLKEDLAANPAAAKAAKEILPKLKAVLSKVQTSSRTHKSAQPPDDAVKPMWRNQADLPRLPIPDLESTQELFLEVSETIVSRNVFKDLKAKTNAFFSSDAAALQAKLVKIDENHPNESWFHDFHNDMYMNARYPTFLFKNPCAVCKDELLRNMGIEGQLNTAAHIVCATMIFAERVISETLEPDEFKGFPLDMLQYSRMFGTTRIPQKERDSFIYAKNLGELRHIVVARDGKWWKLDVNGKLKDVKFHKVRASLEAIMRESDEDDGAAEDIGALTCDGRDDWAENRIQLVSEEANEGWIRCIDEALFVLCLDRNAETVTASSEEIKSSSADADLHSRSSLDDAMRAACHGDMSSRWFDKPLQVIITPDGKVCSNSEHSWGDGIALVRWGKEILEEMQEQAYVSAADADGEDSYATERFRWSLTDDMRETIRGCKRKAERVAETWTFSEFYFKEFGADFFKQNKLSPDGVMQQILQLAYMKKHGKFVSTYCIAQHMAFKAGRNERMRSNTGKALAFVQSVIDGRDVGEQYNLLKVRSCFIAGGLVIILFFARRRTNTSQNIVEIKGCRGEAQLLV